MRGNKLEKSHIHILESDTLSRESRVTETAQEIVSSITKALWQEGGDFSNFWCLFVVCQMTFHTERHLSLKLIDHIGDY